jgi:hypothetical protein
VLKHWAIFIGKSRMIKCQKAGVALPSSRYVGLNDFHPFWMKGVWNG